MSNNGAKVHRLVVLVGPMLLASHADANPIQVENAKPGTSSWQLSTPAPNREIEGYASLTSVNRGGTISLFVSTSDPGYTIEVFRMGWYQGLGARQVMGPVTRAGMIQTMPDPDPVTGLIECNWLDPYQLTIPFNASDPTDWASGVYVAKLTGNASHKQSYVVFVVRDDARPSNFLFQSSVTTAAAYNVWGGKSLYPYSSCGPVATKVSFNRPYKRYAEPICDPGPDPDIWGGAGEFFSPLGGGSPGGDPGPDPGWEYNMVRFLEREGADVTYCTDVDTHEQSNLLLSHKGFLSVGHDEYWSWEMRAHVEAARDNGVNLGFFCANTCYWQIRLEPDATGAPNRTIVCYKDAFIDDPLWLTPDHSRVTALWREPLAANRPEGALLGVQFGAYGFPAQDLVIFDASHWICHGTGLHNNDVLAGLVGNEIDAQYTGPNAPSNIAIIARSPFLNPGNPYSDFVAHTAASGATVVATGTFQWSWGLDDYGADPSVGPVARQSFISAAAQQMTRNILWQFIGAVWVDFGYTGTETGSLSQPFNTLSEAVADVPTGGCVILRPGSSNETLTISRAMTLEASSGVVRIGG